jgi:hypothetical protein
MPASPAFIVHDLAQARIVFAAASVAQVPVRIESAAGAAGHAGAGWWAAMIAAARHEYPEVEATCILDCGEEPGRALGAVREGVEAIRCRARPRARARLEALAEAAGVLFVTGTRGPALDLGAVVEPGAAAAAWLAPRNPYKRPPGPHKGRGKRPRRTLQKA